MGVKFSGFFFFFWSESDGIGTYKSKSLFVFFFFSLGPHSRHMEIPRLGVQSELQLLATVIATATPDPSSVCDLHHSAPWVRQGIEPTYSWFLVRFISAAPQQELLERFLKYTNLISHGGSVGWEPRIAASCDVDCRCILDLELLWLWHRLAAQRQFNP